VVMGMSLSAFTVLHVVLSLVALAAGIVVAAGFVTSRPMPGITALFLVTTLLASLTGLAFPSARFGLGHQLGIVSVLVLLPTAAALYVQHLAGAWRWIFTTGVLTVLWLNGVIGIFQAYAKLAVLQPSARPEIVNATQLVLFAIFVALALLAARRFHPEIYRERRWRRLAHW